MQECILFHLCRVRTMTLIVKTKNSGDCLLLELDSGESLKIPHRVSVLYALEAGKVLGSEEYAQLKIESQRYRCAKMALDYLAICPRSGTEMERYLARKGFDHDLLMEVLINLRESGYLNDADYAARYISSRLSRKLVGKNLLAGELQRKGVSRSVIRQALKESEALHGDPDALYETAVKKYASIKHKRNPLLKLSMFLLGRGFDGSAVTDVVERIKSEEKDQSAE